MGEALDRPSRGQDTTLQGRADGHDSSEYGAHVAHDYDRIYEGVFETDRAVDCLADLAGPGPALELGVGTGRVAIPLAGRGVDVYGVDGSPEMLELLRAKAGGQDVHPVLGDFSRTVVPGSFSLVYLLVNTIYALPDQMAQVECFRTAARHLAPGGRFVLEAWVPDPPAHGVPRTRPRRLGPGFTGLIFEEHDRRAQILSTTQMVVAPTGEVATFPVVHRYAWPSELDLMAVLAGLSLEHRWADWQRAEFRGDSPDHISVWRRDD